ncbi:hypothetical protein B0H67DRAFT_110804 [Lasiosphaeris hirsuta]|uniref:Uncharacterized protein n=1 Tax=Lasiosphaeris hirsuta TaxID=260670 RepID=A0AA40AZ85_9PEZI|nr:hypothetical protein B0H67DRAFT_110804 [Lasiosphaeris hirsuta]
MTQLSKHTGGSPNTLTGHSHSHNSMLLHLACESESTARSVKMITLIPLLYLPPSFLATVFGMNFFVVTDIGKTPRLGLLRDSWLYLAIAVPLTALTVVVWLYWQGRERRAVQNSRLSALGRESSAHPPPHIAMDS